MSDDNSGVFIGKRHSQCDSTGCGIRFVVESTGQHVEVEGGGCTGKVCKAGEAALSDKALSDPKKRDYVDKTNAEIIDEINKRSGAGTIFKPDSFRMSLPFSTLVPSSLTTRGNFKPS